MSLQIPSVRWMHSLLVHPGIEKLYATMSKHFWFPCMKVVIPQFTNQCNNCQRIKTTNRPHGKLPPKNLHHLNPWDQVDVDLIGPWKIQMNNVEYKYRALTCVDLIIAISEIIPIQYATSQTTATSFENDWLSRYPRPSRCSHDN